ncbi:hypothetical protein Leryth_015530 [Lithospermum erythrorhizon]|nr:hypothetical protein Leryth_015530 [Lithospermum erythrorhizon]
MAFRANPLSLSVGETELEAWLRETGYLEIVDQGSSSSILGSILTLAVTVLTVNPFSKLRSDDFSGGTPSWSRGGFIGCVESYSFPWSTEQARMRVHENVKRYARNYSSLFLLFFASSLQILIRIAQCVTAVILICSNVQMAFLCTLGVSYAVMILHASFRKLNQPSKQDGKRRK